MTQPKKKTLSSVPSFQLWRSLRASLVLRRSMLSYPWPAAQVLLPVPLSLLALLLPLVVLGSGCSSITAGVVVSSFMFSASDILSDGSLSVRLTCCLLRGTSITVVFAVSSVPGGSFSRSRMSSCFEARESLLASAMIDELRGSSHSVAPGNCLFCISNVLYFSLLTLSCVLSATFTLPFGILPAAMIGGLESALSHRAIALSA